MTACRESVYTSLPLYVLAYITSSLTTPWFAHKLTNQPISKNSPTHLVWFSVHVYQTLPKAPSDLPGSTYLDAKPAIHDDILARHALGGGQQAHLLRNVLDRGQALELGVVDALLDLFGRELGAPFLIEAKARGQKAAVLR